MLVENGSVKYAGAAFMSYQILFRLMCFGRNVKLFQRQHIYIYIHIYISENDGGPEKNYFAK